MEKIRYIFLLLETVILSYKKHLTILAEHSNFFDKIYSYSPKDIDKILSRF